MSMFSDVGIVFLMVTQELSVCFRNELLVLACDFFFFLIIFWGWRERLAGASRVVLDLVF